MADEWEETFVFAELRGVTSGQLFPVDGGNSQAEILGLVSDQPVMQINGHTFAGHYEDSVGCNLFMEKDKAVSAAGSDTSTTAVSAAQDGGVKFFCKTDKMLVMQPAFLVDKVSSCSTQTAKKTHAAEKSVMPEQEQGS